MMVFQQASIMASINHLLWVFAIFLLHLSNASPFATPGERPMSLDARDIDARDTTPCGVNSLNGIQKCPLGLCCSLHGYCGATEAYCTGSSATNYPPATCQEGYGSCHLVPPPSCSNTSTSASNGRHIAYYQSQNIYLRPCNRILPSNINTTGLTHLIFAFAAFDPVTFYITPVTQADYGLYPQFTSLKSKTLETWIAIGGSTFSPPGPMFNAWSTMTQSAANRAVFIQSLIQFLEDWGFQGVDLDWEFPGLSYLGGDSNDTENLVLLVKEMREAFGTKYGISSVLPPDITDLSTYNPTAMSPFVDFFNFMAYDLAGVLSRSIAPQTSILAIQSALIPLWYAGLSPSQINLGIAFYGRGYTLQNTSCTLPGCPFSGPSLPGPCTNTAGVLALQEIELLIANEKLTPTFYPDLLVKSITYDCNQWMAYDDAETIILKMAWANTHCLGGTAIWSLDFYSGPGSGDPTTPFLTPSLTAAGTCEDVKMVVSESGACGNGVTCLGSPYGNCCSGSGYCGSSDAYCGVENGCQSGFGSCG